MVWILFAVGLWTGAALFSALEGRKQRRFLERWNGWPFRPDGTPRARGRPRSFPEFSVKRCRQEPERQRQRQATLSKRTGGRHERRSDE